MNHHLIGIHHVGKVLTKGRKMRFHFFSYEKPNVAALLWLSACISMNTRMYYYLVVSMLCNVWCWFICDSIEIDLQQEEERDFTISHCKDSSLSISDLDLPSLSSPMEVKSFRICVGISKGHRKRPLHTIRYNSSWILPHKV